MRISAIPQIYRHLNRWREILGILSKYELAHWIGRLGPDFAKDLLKAPGGTSIARIPWETRVRLAFVELGPTFVKLGQLLSTRPDLVGVALAEDLQHLQADVPGDPPEEVRATIEAEFGQAVAELFVEFDETPLASASIGQVHSARLHDGQPVVVKVQHADIRRKVAIDLDILAGLAQLAEMIPEFQNYRPRAVVAEFHRVLSHELDFGRELRHLEQFARDFRKNPTVRIPRPIGRLSSARVLTMDKLDGVKVSDRDALETAGIDLAEVARRGAELYLEMIFGHGYYHADPHPGNVLLMDGNVIGLLDFGMIGRLDERLHDEIEEGVLALDSRDAEHLTSIIVRVGAVPADLDRSALCADVADFIFHYGAQSLDEFDLSGALRDLTEMIHRYRITLPPRIALLIKVLITLEGTSRHLNPQFSLLEIMLPYRRKMMWRRYSPWRRLRKLRRLMAEVEHLIEILPRGLTEIFQQVESGKFDVHLDHRGLEPSVNRLVLGMLASALYLGSSLLVSRHMPPLLWGVSIPGVAGCVVSILLGWRLWRAISKSGHLERRR